MKIILICLTVLACTGMFIYFSPYQTFMIHLSEKIIVLGYIMNLEKLSQ